mmetsp:Transcript_13759/g.44131  ORF Transcript_13759/g.44131 Transcript_13759/m.44131 type:complete len:229 (+) Transcript_13759:1056-1742(+)
MLAGAASAAATGSAAARAAVVAAAAAARAAAGSEAVGLVAAVRVAAGLESASSALPISTRAPTPNAVIRTHRFASAAALAGRTLASVYAPCSRACTSFAKQSSRRGEGRAAAGAVSGARSKRKPSTTSAASPCKSMMEAAADLWAPNVLAIGCCAAKRAWQRGKGAKRQSSKAEQKQRRTGASQACPRRWPSRRPRAHSAPTGAAASPPPPPLLSLPSQPRAPPFPSP